MNNAVRFGLIGAVVGALFVFANAFQYRDAVVTGEPFVPSFAGSDSALDVILASGDGQAFAQLATDPTLSRPQEFGGGSNDLLYRAQRPVFAYLTWLGSLGNPDRVPLTMALLSALSVGLATGALAAVFQRRSIEPALSLCVVVVPGIYASFPFLMPGALAAAFGIAGLYVWESPNRNNRTLAISGTLFTIAVLTRETLVFFPAGLALAEVVIKRRIPSAWLAAPFLGYATWLVTVQLLVGQSLIDSEQSSAVTSAPLVGLLESWPGWLPVGLDMLIAGSTLALFLAAVVWRRHDALVFVALVGLGASTLMSELVWGSWVNWTRALVPVHLALIVALLTPPTRAGIRGMRT